jgi:hypothetical protein
MSRASGVVRMAGIGGWTVWAMDGRGDAAEQERQQGGAGGGLERSWAGGSVFGSALPPS